MANKDSQYDKLKSEKEDANVNNFLPIIWNEKLLQLRQHHAAQKHFRPSAHMFLINVPMNMPEPK